MSDYDSIESLQAKGIIDSPRVASIKVWLIMFTHTCVFAVLASRVFAIWLDKQVHLDALEIGELLGMKTIIAVFYKPLFGWLLDKTQLRIWVVLSIAIFGVASGPFFQFVYQPLLMTHNPTLFYMAGWLGGIYFGYVVIAGSAAVYGYCGRYIVAHGGTEDKIGSASITGWFIMDIFMNFMYTVSPIWGFYVASLSAVGMIVVLFSLKVKPFNTLDTKTTSKQKVKMSDLKYAITNPRFIVIAFFSITILVAAQTQFSQLGRYNLYFWPDNMQSFGLRFFSIISIPVHLIVIVLITRSSGVIKKLNPSRSLILIACCYTLCFIVLGFAGVMHTHMADGHYIPSLVVSIFGNQLLVFVNTFPALVIMTYVNMSFNKKIASTVFLVGYAFISNFGSSFANVVEGAMFKTQGWAYSYLELGAFILACAVILSGIMLAINSYEKKKVMAHVKTETE